MDLSLLVFAGVGASINPQTNDEKAFILHKYFKKPSLPISIPVTGGYKSHKLNMTILGHNSANNHLL